jgi:hypothetical protein
LVVAAFVAIIAGEEDEGAFIEFQLLEQVDDLPDMAVEAGDHRSVEFFGFRPIAVRVGTDVRHLDLRAIGGGAPVRELGGKVDKKPFVAVLPDAFQ